jgi:hypothetical protein
MKLSGSLFPARFAPRAVAVDRLLLPAARKRDKRLKIRMNAGFAGNQAVENTLPRGNRL